MATAAEHSVYRQLSRSLKKLQKGKRSSPSLSRALFGHCISPTTLDHAVLRLLPAPRSGHRGGTPGAGPVADIDTAVHRLLRSFVALMQARAPVYRIQRGLHLLKSLRDDSDDHPEVEPLRSIFCNVSNPDAATTLVVPTLVNDSAFSKEIETNPFFTKHHQHMRSTPFALEFLLAEVLRCCDTAAGDLAPLASRELCGRLPRSTVTNDGIAQVELDASHVGGSTVSDPPPEVFQYHIRLINVSTDATFRLLSRRWAFHDPQRGTVHEVVGPGVVGNFPLLRPGEKYEYSSGTTLSHGSHGYMHGEFQLATVKAGDTSVAMHHAAIRATGLMRGEDV